MPNANLLGEMCMRANLSAQVCGADLLGEKFLCELLSAQVWLDVLKSVFRHRLDT